MNSPGPENDFERKVRRKTIIAFVVFGLGILFALIGWRWLRHQPVSQGTIKPLRKGFEFNEKVFKGVFSQNHLEPEYPKSKAVKKPRVNGDLGLKKDQDLSSWKLKVFQPGMKDTIFLGLDEIKALPKTEIVYNFKCIEGWSQVTHWGGVKFADFANKYKLGTKSGKLPVSFPSDDMYKYIGLVTPDKTYYVGIDYESMFHPQTLLCYELNGKPLSQKHGAPLRLIIPVKYGIKSLKRIGTLYFSDNRPPDYWAERGYDYYSGL